MIFEAAEKNGLRQILITKLTKCEEGIIHPAIIRRNLPVIKYLLSEGVGCRLDKPSDKVVDSALKRATPEMMWCLLEAGMKFKANCRAFEHYAGPP